MQLLKWITSLFATASYQDDVEFYVASKHPKSTAEVEYWIQHYNQQRHRGDWAI